MQILLLKQAKDEFTSSESYGEECNPHSEVGYLNTSDKGHWFIFLEHPKIKKNQRECVRQIRK